MNSGAPTLSVTAHGAQNLDSVEVFGKQDPYARFSLDFKSDKAWQKTFVHKDAGKNPTWNQSFTFSLNGEPELYVEIMDEETMADAPIGFAAIPINQVVYAPGGTMNGIFDVFTPSGKQLGQITLTLAAHNVPGQNTAFAQQATQPVKGTSHINEAHHQRVKKLKTKETTSDVAAGGLGAIAAVGAGLLINKLVNDKEKEEKAKKEAEAAAAAERERFEEEKRRLEQERQAFAQQQQQQQAVHTTHPTTTHGSDYHDSHSSHHYEYDSHKKDKHHKKEKHHGSHSDSDSSDSDSDGEYKKKGKKKWNPTGSYSSGDKVKFEGRKYVCLQGHTSNPTWRPDQAHSLWQAL